MSTLIAAIICLIAGGTVGLLAAAICVAAANRDER